MLGASYFIQIVHLGLFAQLFFQFFAFTQLTEELLQGDFRQIENHLITDGGPLALVGHHHFLQSYLLEAAGAGIQPDLASISVVDYDMAWKQGKLIAYFTPALKKLKKED